MEKREIAEVVEKRPYFEVVASNPETERDDGTRDMGELSPFLICGGRNTERFYFTHINDKTDYRFNIRPTFLKPCFPDSTESLKKLLKKEKFLKDTAWVENLCADGKLDKAIVRAEKNIEAAVAIGKLEEQSYSYVYKVFKKS